MRRYNRGAAIILICAGFMSQISVPELVAQDFFSTEELFEMELLFNFDSLLLDMGDDPGYHKGQLIYRERDSTRIAVDVEIRARGNFRKRPGNCDFPPSKLNFRRNPGRVQFLKITRI